jgi:predicted RNase H-like HicB family nuclease
MDPKRTLGRFRLTKSGIDRLNVLRLNFSACYDEKSWNVSGDANLMLRIEVEEETDGRFIAEVPDLPGVMSYGQSRDEAIIKVEALALRVLADRVEHGEPVPGFPQIFSAA